MKSGAYGRIVRVDLDKHDRRIFTPTPWGSLSWRRGYNRSSAAMERINVRLDRSFNFENHYTPAMARSRAGTASGVCTLAKRSAPASPMGLPSAPGRSASHLIREE